VDSAWQGQVAQRLGWAEEEQGRRYERLAGLHREARVREEQLLHTLRDTEGRKVGEEEQEEDEERWGRRNKETERNVIISRANINPVCVRSCLSGRRWCVCRTSCSRTDKRAAWPRLKGHSSSARTDTAAPGQPPEQPATHTRCV